MKEETCAFPTSFSQQRLWFLEQLTPGRAVYNIPCALRFKGHLDLAALKKSINEIVRNVEKHSLTIKNKILLLSKSLEGFDVQRSLKRGFVLVKQNSKFVKRASDFNNKEKAQLKFHDAEITTH